MNITIYSYQINKYSKKGLTSGQPSIFVML